MLKSTNITVEGVGHFPLDMLRYDQCAPYSSDDVAKIDTSEYQQRRRVRLVRYSDGGRPATVDRWRSFLWNVVEDSAR